MNKNLCLPLLRFSVACLIILSFASKAIGQQGHVYNQFFMNPFIYNPAYAGVDGHAVVFAMYKQQWANIPSGPKLMHASYHVPLKGGIGFGATAFNDQQGPLQTNAGKITGSYLVNIDRKHFLRLGMSLGMGTNQLVLPEDAIADPAFAGSGSNHLIGDFGVTYHFDHFNVGFSLPNLFSSPIVSENGLSDVNFKPTDHMLFKMNYRGHINHEFAIEPHVLYRYSSVLPSQFEIATVVHIKHIAWVGGTYRQDVGMVGLLGVKLKKKFAVGAAFELGNSDYNSLTGSSYEIHIGMHFGSHHKEKGGHKKDHVEHHKSWFLTHSDEKIKENEDKLRNEELLAQQEDLPAPIVAVQEKEESVDWEISNEILNVPQQDGSNLTAEKLERLTKEGQNEYVAAFIPSRGEGRAWALAPGVRSFEERDNQGTKEVQIKWVRLSADNSLESKTAWEPILDEKGLADLLSVKGQPAVISNEETEEVEPSVTTPPVSTPPTPDPQPSDEELSESTEPLETNSGTSRIEFPSGIYLIGGSFKGYQQAEDYSDRMFHRGYRDVRVGKINGREGWYVVLKKYNSIDAANQDRDKVNQSIKGVWVLKVN